MEMKVPFKVFLWGRNKRTCTGGFRGPCVHARGSILCEIEPRFYYLSRQHLVEQHTVGPPVHRLVVGLVGHDLQRDRDQTKEEGDHGRRVRGRVARISEGGEGVQGGVGKRERKGGWREEESEVGRDRGREGRGREVRR